MRILWSFSLLVFVLFLFYLVLSHVVIIFIVLLSLFILFSAFYVVEKFYLSYRAAKENRLEEFEEIHYRFFVLDRKISNLHVSFGSLKHQVTDHYLKDFEKLITGEDYSGSYDLEDGKDQIDPILEAISHLIKVLEEKYKEFTSLHSVDSYNLESLISMEDFFSETVREYELLVSQIPFKIE